MFNSLVHFLKKGFYLHSFSETFEVLDKFLYRKLIEKNLNAPKKLQDKLLKTLNHNIISTIELEQIQELKIIFNSIHREDLKPSKDQTEKAISVIKKLIEQPSSQHKADPNNCP